MSKHNRTVAFAEHASRRQLSLAEVLAALRQLDGVGVKPDSAVFNDLQAGILITEVRFPGYRNGRTSIPPSYWQEKEFGDFFDGGRYRSRRETENDEFSVAAYIFANDEWRKLKQTTLAVCHGDLTDSDSEFTEYFKKQGWVKPDRTIVDREELAEFCYQAQYELTKAEVEGIRLQVFVRSPSLPDYLAEVKARFAPPDPKKKRTENWDAIFHETIRRVIQDPNALAFGNRTRFVDKLWKWACEKYGTNNVPGPDMIRVRLDEIIEPIKAILISNRR
jgi:hypothetical protein